MIYQQWKSPGRLYRYIVILYLYNIHVSTIIRYRNSLSGDLHCRYIIKTNFNRLRLCCIYNNIYTIIRYRNSRPGDLHCRYIIKSRYRLLRLCCIYNNKISKQSAGRFPLYTRYIIKTHFNLHRLCCIYNNKISKQSTGRFTL